MHNMKISLQYKIDLIQSSPVATYARQQQIKGKHRGLDSCYIGAYARVGGGHGGLALPNDCMIVHS